MLSREEDFWVEGRRYAAVLHPSQDGVGPEVVEFRDVTPGEPEVLRATLSGERLEEDLTVFGQPLGDGAEGLLRRLADLLRDGSRCRYLPAAPSRR